MIKIYNCIVDSHDLNLTLLAVALCIVSSATGISLLQYANDARDRSHWTRLGISSVATGSGIWATHFVAMLAFSPNLPTSYDPLLTAVSFLLANTLAVAAFALAMTRKSLGRQALGGLVLGAGIVAMHFTGMAAYRIKGVLLWDMETVAIAIVFGLLAATLAVPVALRARSVWMKIVGGAVLTLAICGHHLLAMGAISVIPDVDAGASTALPPIGWIAAVVVISSVSVATLALIEAALDVREKRRVAMEDDRLESLAEVAIDGLIVCKKGRIVTLNNHFANLVGADHSKLIGSKLDEWVTDDMSRGLLSSRPCLPFETSVRNTNGQQIPVELVQRAIELHGKQHQAIAIRDLRARKETEERLQFLAHHDSLTGLSNRAQLNRTMDNLLESMNERGERGTSFAVYSIDLDRFKHINETYGYDCGDLYLIKVAQRLREAISANDFIARTGEDEFVVIQPNVTTVGHAEGLSAYLASLIAEPVELGERVLKTTASIGVAFAPTDGTTSEQVLKSADLALGRAKLIRNNVSFFVPEMDDSFRDRLQLERMIARAVSIDGFVLHFQPIVDSRSAEVLGFEALIRMKSENGSLISPGVFIPAAEEMGHLGQIGAWALKEACLTARTWPNDLFVAVNLSPAQFGVGNIVALVSKTIEETGLSPDRLELEITESLLLDDSEHVMAELQGLRELGARVVMDDFGTGYSSLNYLWKFPFDKLKVDRSFMSDFENTGDRVKTVLRTIIGLGRELKMRITIEGVETAQQVAFIKSVNGDQIQGFFFGPPIPAIDIPLFISQKESALKMRNSPRLKTTFKLVN